MIGNWIDVIPTVQDNVRTDRKVPPINFISHLTPQSVIDQMNQPHIDAVSNAPTCAPSITVVRFTPSMLYSSFGVYI